MAKRGPEKIWKKAKSKCYKESTKVHASSEKAFIAVRVKINHETIHCVGYNEFWMILIWIIINILSYILFLSISIIIRNLIVFNINFVALNLILL